MNNKVLITGTGRSGTTFLVALLTELGLNTGFTKDNYMDFVFSHCKGGLEHHSVENDFDIIKNPNFCLKIKELIKKINIDIVYIPIRDINEVTASRLVHGNKDGGLLLTEEPSEQYDKLCFMLGKLISDLIKHKIPYEIIDFEIMIEKPEYLYTKMNFILHNIPFKVFDSTYKKIGHKFISKKT